MDLQELISQFQLGSSENAESAMKNTIVDTPVNGEKNKLIVTIEKKASSDLPSTVKPRTILLDADEFGKY